MANAERGEVSVDVGGRSLTLKIGTNAMCEIEAATGKTITEIGRLLGSEETASIELMRVVFWGALQHHHEGLTLKDAGNLIDEIGPSEIGPLIGRAFEAAFPAAKGGKENPPKAAA